jgi:hypothetical protein
MRTTRFWNNLHQVRSKSKDRKAKLFKVLGAIKPKDINRPGICYLVLPDDMTIMNQVFVI